MALGDKGEIRGLVGIVSFGGIFNGAQGFTSVGAFFEWITNTTGITSCLEPKGEVTVMEALRRLLFGENGFPMV